MDKSNDCYFYYYSTCTKGKKCPFRHCDLALGSEVVCELWRIGRCKDLNCPFRHMEPNIKRTAIPCWFESQPTGCRKPHCVFQHSKPRPSLMEVQPGQDLILPTGGNSVNLQTLNHNSANEPEIKLPNIESKIPQKSKINISIERDEESDDQENNVEEKEIKDNEVKVKTLEQIRMEKILNSSPDDSIQEIVPKKEDIKSNETLLLLRRPVKNNISNGIKVTAIPLMEGKEDCTFVVKTLDQIRKEREEIENQGDSQDVLEKPTLKENQTPNLLKRSIEIDENSSGSVNSRRPVKIRRNRTSTSTNSEITNDMCDQGLQLNDENTKTTSNEFSNSITLDNKNNLSNVDYTDLDEFDLDDVPANSADANIDSDDELMREIDQVINS